MGVRRIYVEKKADFSVKSKELEDELKNYLQLDQITAVRILNRYDIENLSDETYQKSLDTIFSEPPLDILYEEIFPFQSEDFIFSVEYLPGQFDQRADSAVQCVNLLDVDAVPMIRSAITYIISGVASDQDQRAIKSFCVNPVDSREAKLEKPKTLKIEFAVPEDIPILVGFCHHSAIELETLYQSFNLAMTLADFTHIQQYYQTIEKRNPTMTEIRVLDTYWSDHCRHTTFQTELKEVVFGDGDYQAAIKTTYQQYLQDRLSIVGDRTDKYVCLMDLALMAMKKLSQQGVLNDLEESDEINACSIVVPVIIDGKSEEWLINFKNETHNHPTEIEPFGGAATCLGGAIRDPLSGRTYVYQAMRITGAADPTKSLNQTLKGKLAQRKLVRGAANGYSSYGNQIGLATGLVKEIYHPNYVAKRMEIGAVLGAAPRKQVVRESSDPGDIIILLGGRTGRDGIGGATGSSKIHTKASIEVCGAEVQKGNPPTERKIQRLFRRPEVSLLIKKCNDFGAGGIAVAIGELAAGLEINLDHVSKKYTGLDGTEIAISESQERMAVVVAPQHVASMLAFAEEENLEAIAVAVVTSAPRLVMNWRGKKIVDISRAFLDTNGAHQQSNAFIEMPVREDSPFIRSNYQLINVLDRAERGQWITEQWIKLLQDLNVCSQKGLVELFDSSIGAGSVMMPYGGKYQLSEIQTMVAKLPVLTGQTNTVTMMSYGFDPYLSSWSPYHGSVYAILTSVAKIVAVGGDYQKIHFTFQEYFQRMNNDPHRWGQPLSALLGAYHAQLGLGLASIGGKDSMSGTFYDETNGEIHVPPTLVSFAVCVSDQSTVVSPELKRAGSKIIHYHVTKDENDLPDFETLKINYRQFHDDVKSGKILSAYAVEGHGIAAAVSKMAFGNKLGVAIDECVSPNRLFDPGWGDLIFEVSAADIATLSVPGQVIGEVTTTQQISYGVMSLSLTTAIAAWREPLEKVFPTQTTAVTKPLKESLFDSQQVYICQHKVAKPHVFIPVFPGTNCEYDSIRAFEAAGATVSAKVFRNLSASQIRASVELYRKEISKAQLVMFPGGFSAGDEPDGSAKFFATAFRNAVIKEELEKMLYCRDGLLLGICNGFQALIKLGLVVDGQISTQSEMSPTLAQNTIGRHISKMVYTKVVSNHSPWLQKTTLGDVYCNPVSHGEGRFIADQLTLKKLFQNGQVATQYVDEMGNPTMAEQYNPNGSYLAVEGITSPDGRILGKMAHSERHGQAVAINIYGQQNFPIFESGINYFK